MPSYMNNNSSHARFACVLPLVASLLAPLIAADFDDLLPALEELDTPATPTTPATPAEVPTWTKKETDEGYLYFFNNYTQESVWEQPVDYVEPAAEEIAAAAPVAQTVWNTRYTDEGYEYYYNTQTLQSVWEKPTDFGGDAAAAAVDDVSGMAEDHITSDSSPRGHLQFSSYGMFASIKVSDRPWQRKWVSIKFSNASNSYELAATNSPSLPLSLSVSDYEKLNFSLPTITTLVKSTKVRPSEEGRTSGAKDVWSEGRLERRTAEAKRHQKHYTASLHN